VIAANISRRYAKAVLELASETSEVDAVAGELTRAAQAYEGSVELQRVMGDPLVPHVSKKAILVDLAAALSLGPVARSTMLLLGDRRRLRLLPEVAQLLGEMNDVKKGVVRAEVTSAVNLPDAFYARLKTQLETMTKKTVVLDKKTDPALIGGIVTRIGDQVFDGSIRTRLASLKNALMPN
jgi:F-type H+-transporting ATPase subunit delta